VILGRARGKGRVDVAALADEFDVTTETVRCDLTVLERQGVPRRVRGGAIPLERLGFEPTLSVRETVMTDEKSRIAKAALAELATQAASCSTPAPPQPSSPRNYQPTVKSPSSRIP
jgi:DeoR family fructose operon transcriptional repressor